MYDIVRFTAIPTVDIAVDDDAESSVEVALMLLELLFDDEEEDVDDEEEEDDDVDMDALLDDGSDESEDNDDDEDDPSSSANKSCVNFNNFKACCLSCVVFQLRRDIIWLLICRCCSKHVLSLDADWIHLCFISS